MTTYDFEIDNKYHVIYSDFIKKKFENPLKELNNYYSGIESELVEIIDKKTKNIKSATEEVKKKLNIEELEEEVKKIYEKLKKTINENKLDNIIFIDLKKKQGFIWVKK